MPQPTDLSKWYWKADDGRAFSAERGIIVTEQDEDYKAFAASNKPARWARDANGNQTETSLFEALAPFGLGLSLARYAAQLRWEKEVGGITINGIPIFTDDRSKQMILGARVAAMTNANFTTTWVAADGTLHPMDATLITAISDAVLEHVRSCFATYANVLTEINSGGITSKAQIDAAFTT